MVFNNTLIFWRMLWVFENWHTKLHTIPTSDTLDNILIITFKLYNDNTISIYIIKNNRI